ncbi:MAG: 30S ribosomal protein S20 [Firmicutes bacterium]|nr:30S ribosomal protein S20 [Bacillota bacterium]
MANIKSSKKRIKVAEKKRVQNKAVKSELSTYVKKYKAAVESKDVEASKELLSKCFSLLDGAAGDNVIHANKAARQKAKLSAMQPK